MSARDEAIEDWVIRKAGYFYRPKRAGYTSDIREAGRYSEVEAKQEAAIEPWHMSAHLASEFEPELKATPSPEDAGMQKIAGLQEENAMLMQVIKDNNRLMSEVCEAIGAGDDDNPVTIAQARMEEIRALEAEETGVRARALEEAARVTEDYNIASMDGLSFRQSIAAAIRALSTTQQPEGFVLVPKSALHWLYGTGPDLAGHWFGDGPTGMDGGKFWWRTKFRKLCDAAPSPEKPAAKEQG